jgi:adenylate cyclase
LRRDDIDLQIRVGLNSGEVIVGEIGSGPGRYTAVGHPVGMAQRMEAAAPPGGVLCSLSTARLVEDAVRLGPVEDVAVKGVDAPVPARHLLAVESDRMVLGRNEGLMLGRDAELNCLGDVLDADGGCLVGVVGAPGLGKSRLISEFSAVAAGRGADIVVARCEAHTTTLAFRALSRLLRAMFKVDGLIDAALRDIDAILALAPEVPAVELAPAKALRGVIEMCLRDAEHGSRLSLNRASAPPWQYAWDTSLAVDDATSTGTGSSPSITAR